MNVYCDYAAQKPMLNCVKKAVRAFLDSDMCNPSAVYSRGRKTHEEIEHARSVIAERIHANNDEIIFTSGSTEAINWAIRESYGTIVTTPIEHKAILENCKRLPKENVKYLDVNGEGLIDLEQLDRICRPHSKIIIGYVNNEIGTIQPIKEIAKIAHAHDSLVFCDATQAIGSIPIDVRDLDVDMMCCSAQKIGALAGCGFLYVKYPISIRPLLCGGSQEHYRRAGTENVCGILAMAVAVDEVTRNVEERTAETAQKRDRIAKALLTIPKSHINGSLGNRVCNNINITFEGVSAETLVLMLDTKGIYVSSGSACSSQSTSASHVLKAIGLNSELATSTIRITIGDNITEPEINYLILTITECVTYLRERNKHGDNRR